MVADRMSGDRVPGEPLHARLRQSRARVPFVAARYHYNIDMSSPTVSLVERIEALLPQTQCCRCGYDGCAPYAQAIATRKAAINQCPPGGGETIVALAQLLGVAPQPLDLARGSPKPFAIARIDESSCIGCTLCIQACPVDAIGCELCLPPCPVDCITMFPANRAWMRADAERARKHYHSRQSRLARDKSTTTKATTVEPGVPSDDLATRQAAIAVAFARARARRAARQR